jgi:DNA-binding GntR family transcriptional regulator
MKFGFNRAYEILKQRIVGGQYKPGSQLKEIPIAKELDLSRTPVRAALKRLVEDGLAIADLGRGVYVAAWTDWDVHEIFELRLLLEPYAAQLAAERGTEHGIALLEESNAQMANAIAQPDEDAVLRIQAANRLFHLTLLEMSQSKRLHDMLETMIDMPIITRSFFLYDADDLERSLRHHKDLTMAIKSRNGQLAKQVMQLHLQVSMNRFLNARESFMNATVKKMD